MVLFKVVIRTLFFYFFITISYRLMGKREVGQLGVIDLIVSILIAELVAISIENHSEPIYLTIVPIVVLVLLEILLAYISIKSRSLRIILEGNMPTYLECYSLRTAAIFVSPNIFYLILLKFFFYKHHSC